MRLIFRAKIADGVQIRCVARPPHDKGSIPYDDGRAALNAFGKLELFFIGADYALWEIYQTAPSNGWSDWYSHGKPPGVATIGTPTITSSQDGRLELFGIGNDGALWHIWQLQNIDDPTINNWSGWYSHGTP